MTCCASAGVTEAAATTAAAPINAYFILVSWLVFPEHKMGPRTGSANQLCLAVLKLNLMVPADDSLTSSSCLIGLGHSQLPPAFVHVVPIPENKTEFRRPTRYVE